MAGAKLAKSESDEAALNADGLKADGGMYCRDEFVAEGEVRLLGAHIGLHLDLTGATFANPDGDALSLDGLTVDLDMVCAGVRAQGLVRLPGAHVKGRLGLDRASLYHPAGTVLLADRLTVDQNLTCTSLNTSGEIQLVGAHIGGLFDLGGATLTRPGGYALRADGLTVEQSMFCKPGFRAAGEIRLAGAHIGDVLDLAGATLSSSGRPALSAPLLTVDHDMLCHHGFSATGEVSLLGAHIGGQLSFKGASLSVAKEKTLDLERLQAGGLLFCDLTKRPGLVDFTHAHVGTLANQSTSWPQRAQLDGFTYDAVHEDRVTADQRRGWLASNLSGYSAQPYEQLASVYRRSGRDHDARTIAIAKQRARRRTLGLPGRLWGLLADSLVGYGYRTWLAGLWLLGFFLVGWGVFDRAHDHAGLVLAKPGEAHPGFQGSMYALDTLLPVVDLHQEGVWIPRGWVQWWAWASILAGWILTTAVVAALGGMLKRD
jgi:hypothetical protein